MKDLLWRSCLAVGFSCGLCLFLVVENALAAEVKLGSHKFTLPDGFEIELVAGSPLVNRPICADFDEQGRLYVADSSGSNEKVQVQLEQRPHRIVRLEDTDGDGRYDQSTLFAERMMFPEGALWHDGSLYVAAPPHIWKLTDTDGDGQADRREEWFDGKTLTGCANDLHGPYLGPDGWIYWCKGAFAEQTYQRPGRSPLVTRAAHIFRRRPEGGPIEPVMTGGMDNPVEVVFTPGGERIFTTTFLQRPSNGLRDGLIHAVYGGVYGKIHGVLDGHPRTGPIMPVLSHLGAAAPCGLLRLETDQLGAEYRNNVLACLFNMHKLTRHRLKRQGATFESRHEDFLVSDNLDFHPTDVLEDADGSLLVVNTGGWYKLCCPTSQLYKPDILGDIYRVRRIGAHQMDDPRGKTIAWSEQSPRQLAALLADSRFALRNRARAELGGRGAAAVASLREVLTTSDNRQQRLQAVWALTQISETPARAAVRVALADENETIRQAALHSISVRRDPAAESDLVRMLQNGSSHNRRAAAEALGRVGSARAVSALLSASAGADDRVIEHSLIYALLEISAVEPTRRALQHEHPHVRRAALIALDQMPGTELSATDVLGLLNSEDQVLQETAWWITEHHGEWAGELRGYFRQAIRETPSADRDALERLSARLARFAGDAEIQKVMAEGLAEESAKQGVPVAIVNAMFSSGLKTMPDVWAAPLYASLQTSEPRLLEVAVSAVKTLAGSKPSEQFVERLRAIAGSDQLSAPIRLQALVAIPGNQRNVQAGMLRFLCDHLDVEQPVRLRSLAVDVLLSSPLAVGELSVVAEALTGTGPMELKRLMEMFGKRKDERLGLQLVEALSRCPSVSSLSPEWLKQQMSGYGATVLGKTEPLLARIEQENKDKYQKLESILALVKKGDIRRGQRLFQGSKAACSACHAMGYLGGRVGPDLTRIGRIRTERDLLESILFPSASFVRSFEPTTVVTAAGLVHNGLIQNETAHEIRLQIDAQKSVTIAVDEIELRKPGTISIMPTGLDKQFSPQELADLVTFLKSSQ